VGIAGHSIGLNGIPSTADDVVAYMTEQFRAHARATSDVPDGALIDPVCGMRVRPHPKAIVLDHDGPTVGFCSTGCRDFYAKRDGIEMPAIT
jgi:YHS domain-containing protein